MKTEQVSEKHFRIHTVELEGEIYPMGYRVVTEDFKSLGLRQNPNILEYPVRQWYFLPEDQIQEGKDDWGGIWVARIPSKAREIQKYMLERYNVRTKIFYAALGEILYCNNGHIKTDAINMFEELIEKE